MNFFGGREPVDPAYARFRDGWEAWILGKPQMAGLRWSPWDGEGSWRRYALEKFDFIDFGATEPKSPLAHRWVFEDKPGYLWDWDGFFAPAWKLPDLWSAVNENYAAFRGNRPNSVWNPYEGSWREIRSRVTVPAPSPPQPPGPVNPSPPYGTGPGDDDAPAVPSELERRLNELIELHRAGKITDEVLKQRTLELTREYG